MAVSNEAGGELDAYSVGSSLGITVYDPVRKAGGLLHAMLPDSNIDTSKAATVPYMFVDTGVPLLFQAVSKLGCELQHRIIRVAGGAQLMEASSLFNIGERNQQALIRFLAREGGSIQAQDIGGRSSRTLRLDLNTGKLSIRCPGLDPYFL